MFIQAGLSSPSSCIECKPHFKESRMNARVLIITTSHTQLGNTSKATGAWAEEFVVPYYQLLDAGASIILASPQGGAIPFDAGSLKPAGQNEPMVERFLADAIAQALAKQTLVAAAVDASAFDAVFFPGGHGTMWDLPVDAGVTRAVEAAFAANKLIASVCHGAAGLVTAQRADGMSIVKNKRINAFTDAEEAAVGLTAVVPFRLESRLRELGANFEGAANWQAFAVRDGQFITGQNPQSSKLVAQHLCAALGLKVPATPAATTTTETI
jgi:putative intracellular protease/amidase